MTRAGASRVSLVPLEGAYIDDTYHWLKNEELCSLIDCLSAPTIKENNKYWGKQNAMSERKNFAILDPYKKHIGNCGLSNIDIYRRKAEIWIYIAEKQGCGYGRSAMHSLLEYGVCELGLERLYLRVLSTNEKAQKFFKNIGFIFEGRWRRDTMVNNKFVDSLWFSMLAEEFIKTNSKNSECQ